MSDSQTYRNLTEARMQDTTLYAMMRANRSMTEIVLQLANEKAALVAEMVQLKMANPPLLVLHPDGRVTEKPANPPIHFPNIPPNNIQ